MGEWIRRHNSIYRVALASVLVGVVAGLLGVAFRESLEIAGKFRGQFYLWAESSSILATLLLVALTGAACWIAAWLVVRFAPQAAGSGIPQVEASLTGEIANTGSATVPVKFFGGILSMGSGLALGREGPCVQMGASTGEAFAKLFRLGEEDGRVLLAAGSGAGLAVAFGAPIAGAVFVLEELLRRFDLRSTIATLGASTAAICIQQLLLGNSVDFSTSTRPLLGPETLGLFLLLGVILGFAGAIYNRAVIFALDCSERMRCLSVPSRAAVIGAIVAIIGGAVPGSIGDGEAITQQLLSGELTIGVISVYLLIRFIIGPLSYSARTPGGLFAPLLAVGALVGGGYGWGISTVGLINQVGPDFVLVGMMAFFASVVRAPITGIVLITEMTGINTLLLSSLVACFMATLTATALGSEPLYDTLKKRLLR